MTAKLLTFAVLCLSFNALCFAQNNAPELLPVKQNGKWGFIDHQGNIVVQPLYDAFSFERLGRYIIVHQNGRQGILDLNGNIVAPIDFEKINILDANTFISIAEKKPVEYSDDYESFDVIADENIVIGDSSYDGPKLGSSHMEKDDEYKDFKGDLYRIYHISGKSYLAKMYPYIAKYSDTLYLTKHSGKSGLISVSKEIIPPEYDHFMIHNEVVIVNKNKLQGAFSLDGKALLEPKYKKIDTLMEFLITVESEKKALFSPQNNSFVTEHLYDRFIVNPLKWGNCILTVADGMYGLLDFSGAQLLSPEYSYISPCVPVNGMPTCFMMENNKKIGVIHLSGRTIVPADFDVVSVFRRNLFLVNRGQFFGVYNMSGVALQPPTANRIQFFDDYIKVYEKNSLTIIYIDGNGNETERTKYENVSTVNVSGRINPFANSLSPDFVSDTLREGINQSYGWFYSRAQQRWGMRDENDSLRLRPMFENIFDIAETPFTLVQSTELRESKKVLGQMDIVKAYGLVNKEQYQLAARARYDYFDLKNPVLKQGCNYVIGVRENVYEVIRPVGRPLVFSFVGECSNGYARVSSKGKLKFTHVNELSAETTVDLSLRMGYVPLDAGLRELNRLRSRGAAVEIQGGKWGLIDENGQLVIPTLYSMMKNQKNNRVITRGKEKWGVLSTSADTIVPFEYDKLDYLINSSDSMFLLHVFNKKIGLMDTTGRFITRCEFDRIYDFHEGLAAVKVNNRYGFIDKEGNMVVNPIYNKVRRFSEGVAAVKGRTGWGYVDTSGEIVIPVSFRQAFDFHEGLAVVAKNNLFGYIDQSGNMAIPAKYRRANSFSSGLAIVQVKRKQGIIDKQNNFVLKPKRRTLTLSTDQDVIISTRKNKYVFYNLSGKKTGSFKANHLGNFNHQLAPFKKKNKWGFVNTNGKQVMKPQWDQISGGYVGGLAAVAIDGKWGFLDTLGNLVVPLIYHVALPFTEKNTVVRTKNSTLIINKKGDVLYEYKGLICKGFEDGHTQMYSTDRRWSTGFYIDSTGKSIATGRYGRMVPHGRDLYVAWASGMALYGIIDKRGIAVAHLYPAVQYSERGTHYNYFKPESLGEGMYSYSVSAYYNVADFHGNLLFDNDFESISYVGSGIFRVEIYNKTGYLHLEKGWIWRPTG